MSENILETRVALGTQQMSWLDAAVMIHVTVPVPQGALGHDRESSRGEGRGHLHEGRRSGALW